MRATFGTTHRQKPRKQQVGWRRFNSSDPLVHLTGTVNSMNLEYNNLKIYPILYIHLPIDVCIAFVYVGGCWYAPNSSTGQIVRILSPRVQRDDPSYNIRVGHKLRPDEPQRTTSSIQCTRRHSEAWTRALYYTCREGPSTEQLTRSEKLEMKTPSQRMYINNQLGVLHKRL